MGNELLSSKVTVEEQPPKVRGIPSAPTSVFGAVGVTERGPIGVPVLCTSPGEFEATFGGFTREGDVAIAAAGFYENGGAQLWVVRTAHYRDPADPASVTARRASADLLGPGGAAPAIARGALLPLDLDNGDELVVSIGGGADQSIAFRGTPAFVQASGPGPFALADGQTLTLRIDERREQRIVFDAADFADIARATSIELAAAINRQLRAGKALVDAGVLELVSDTRGQGSSIQVTGGTANEELGFPTDPAPGLGNVGDLAAVTLEEVQARLAADAEGLVAAFGPSGELELRTVAVGESATLQVRAASAEGFGFDTEVHRGTDMAAVPVLRVEGKDPGQYAERLDIVATPSLSGAASAFDLLVLREGSLREMFPSVTMRAGDERHVERVVNDARIGSRLIRVTDLGVSGAPLPTPQTVRMSGGDDGLTGLSDIDFIGSEAGTTGLYALDTVQELAVLMVPGRATPAVHQGMVRYCEVHRGGFVFPVLDPPAGMRATEIVAYVERTAGLLNASEYGAIYWPRVRILNPNRTALGPEREIVVPPSGIVCGVYARTDAAREGGVYDPPAGVEVGRMFGVLGFETDECLDEKKRDIVFPKRINPLTSDGGPPYIDGARTLKGNGNFPSVSERRGVIFIKRSVKSGLQFARHRNNDEKLRAEVWRSVTAFLLTQMNHGAFRSRIPSKAFFVDVGEELNTATVIFSGQLLLDMGLATQKPAEFVRVRLSQDTRAIEAELAAAGL